MAEMRPGDDVRRSHVVPRPAAALIEILTYEGDVEGAWTVATDYRCDDRKWLALELHCLLPD